MVPFFLWWFIWLVCLQHYHLTNEFKCFPGFADGSFLGRGEGRVEKSDSEGWWAGGDCCWLLANWKVLLLSYLNSVQDTSFTDDLFAYKQTFHGRLFFPCHTSSRTWKGLLCSTGKATGTFHATRTLLYPFLFLRCFWAGDLEQETLNSWQSCSPHRTQPATLSLRYCPSAFQVWLKFHKVWFPPLILNLSLRKVRLFASSLQRCM